MDGNGSKIEVLDYGEACVGPRDRRAVDGPRHSLLLGTRFQPLGRRRNRTRICMHSLAGNGDGRKVLFRHLFGFLKF